MSSHLYVNFSKNGLKPFADLFERQGQTVIDVKTTNIAKREDGQAIKTATFTFESGQRLAIKIKANGSIFQVRLNGKVLPIKNSDALTEAIKEVAVYLKRNEPAYLKQQRLRFERKQQQGDKTPSAATSLKKQIEQARAKLDERTGINTALSEELRHMKSKPTELARLQAELDHELARRKALRAELAELQRG